MNCQYCNNPVPFNVAFCPSCGAPVPQPPPQQQMPPPPPPMQGNPYMQQQPMGNPYMQQQPMGNHYQQPYVQNTRSRVVYIVLGLLLGSLGVHNFYAGYHGRGISQLLIVIFLGWLGFPFLLVCIWVLIEICSVSVDANGMPMS